MVEKERRVSERSLENLKLGAESRRLGKVRHNFTILPETAQWLKGTGNASDTIDSLVAEFKNGSSHSNHTHDKKDDNHVVSNDVYEREIQDLKRDLEETQLELSKFRTLLEKSQALEKDATDQLCDCHRDAFKAADILKAALKLKSNAGGAIKREIEKALPLIGDL